MNSYLWGSLSDSVSLLCLAYRNYTSRGHVFGFYADAILFGSKARKQAHSKLCNCFRNAATGQKSALEKPKMWPREVYIPFAGQVSAFRGLVTRLR